MSEFQRPFDKIPPGIFEAKTEEEMKGMIFAIHLGRELQTKYPEIADDYKSGFSITQLISKYDIINSYRVQPKTAENAVRYALGGYKGHIEVARQEESYPGLIEDAEELVEIAREHNIATGKAVGTQMRDAKKGMFGLSKEERSAIGKRSGLSQYEKGVGIHAQTIEERKMLGKLLAEAQGKTVFSDEEIDAIKNLINNPQYQRRTRINAEEMAIALNKRFHAGQKVRTPQSVTKICSRLKKSDRK